MLWLYDSSYTKVSEEVNRKFHPENTTVKLSTPYTDPDCHNAQRHRRTDRQMDRRCQ